MNQLNEPHSKAKKRSLPSFLKKTYHMLQDTSNNSIVRWAPHDKGFVVLNEQQFTQQILPKYFKHNNYSSFVRQLNMYNFHKMRESGSESHFYHELFKNNGESIHLIKRKAERKKTRPENQENIPLKKPQPKKQVHPVSPVSPKQPLAATPTPTNTTAPVPKAVVDEVKQIKSPCKAPEVDICLNQKSDKYINSLLDDIEDDEDVSIIHGIEQRDQIERPYLITKELILESTTNIVNFNLQRQSIFSIGSLLLK